MALQAFAKNVIVEPAESEGKQGHIVLPEGARKKPLKGKVISVGGEVSSVLEVGVTVYYSAFVGTEIEVDKRKLLVISQDDILALE